MTAPVPITTVALAVEADIVVARQRARRIAEIVGFDRQDQTRIATAVSEIARNAFSYGGGGRAEFRIGGTPSALIVTISDTGPGIADLEAVLSGDYISPTGMGVGLVGARRLMDRFEIESTSGKGVRITLAKVLPRHAPMVDTRSLSALTDELRTGAAPNSSEELQLANQALMSSLQDLRARQEELAQLNAELEDTNRGVVALYAELDDAAVKLKAASEAKSRFLSHVSHEFRTPLNSILALSRILLDRLDGDLTAEQERQVGYIRKSAESLTDLVNDLLDIAKVEAGKIDLKPAAFEVVELFAGLRGVMKPLQTASGVDLVFEAPEAIPTLHADEARIAQILRNLISNALKFTEAGEVRASVRMAGQDVVFEVRDTGVGIAPEDQARIFEEFEQVSGALQSRSRGTGLGLPLSRRLADLMGGTLTLQSEPGAGSTFTLRIPADMRVGEATPQCVLVVDDEEAFRYALRQMIGPRHRVIEAVDGEAAIQQIREAQPSVIFLDLNMPKLDGYAVLQELADRPETAETRVIVSTAALIEERNRPRLARADFVLSKDQLSRETVAALVAGGRP